MKYPGSKLKFSHGDSEIFGANYVGSTESRKNLLNRKMYNKNK